MVEFTVEQNCKYMAFNLQNSREHNNLRFGYENWLSDNSLAVPYNTKKLE